MSTCLTCGAEMPSTGHGKRYCSPDCFPSRIGRGLTSREIAGEEVTAEPGTREEVIGLLWQAARRGSVTATQVLLKSGFETPVGKRSIIDELATTRGTSSMNWQSAVTRCPVSETRLPVLQWTQGSGSPSRKTGSRTTTTWAVDSWLTRSGFGNAGRLRKTRLPASALVQQESIGLLDPHRISLTIEEAYRFSDQGCGVYGSAGDLEDLPSVMNDRTTPKVALIDAISSDAWQALGRTEIVR